MTDGDRLWLLVTLWAPLTATAVVVGLAWGATDAGLRLDRPQPIHATVTGGP